MLFWPFTDERIAWNTISVIDPLFTIPIFVLVFISVLSRNKRFSIYAIVWILLYQVVAYSQKLRAEDIMYDYAKKAEQDHIGVIIAGAGGSAHLPGMISALTHIPVLGVPVESKKLKGLDSLLSIAQMPKGIPVGTLAIGADGAINAALLAAAIIANNDHRVHKRLKKFRIYQTQSVKKKPK